MLLVCNYVDSDLWDTRNYDLPIVISHRNTNTFYWNVSMVMVVFIKKISTFFQSLSCNNRIFYVKVQLYFQLIYTIYQTVIRCFSPPFQHLFIYYNETDTIILCLKWKDVRGTERVDQICFRLIYTTECSRSTSGVLHSEGQCISKASNFKLYLRRHIEIQNFRFGYS